MEKKVRPQDKWNEKNGLISKSYKLHKSVVDAFSNACQNENCSQAGQLTNFILDFVSNTERRFSVMYIREKYSVNQDNSKALHAIIELALSEITQTMITTKKETIISKIATKPNFSVYQNYLEQTKSFSCNSDLNRYFMDKAPDICNYIKSIMIEQVALFELVQEKKIMPVQPKKNYMTEINIEYTGGNRLFEITFDLYPYETFVILNLNP